MSDVSIEAPSADRADPIAPDTVAPPLEAVRGRLREASRTGLAGAQGLVLPLLWSVGTDQQVWSLGPFGESWWVVLVTSLGFGFLLLRALLETGRTLRACARLVSEGHRWEGVLLIAFDDRGESEPLIDGRRRYAGMSEARRMHILHLRMRAGMAHLLAMLWTPFAFAILVVLAAHLGISRTVLWLGTLGPAAVLFLVAHGYEWLQHREYPVVQDGESRDEMAKENGSPRAWFALAVPDPAAARGFDRAARAVTVIALISAFPIPTLVLAAAFAPEVARIALPSFQVFLNRTAETEALTQYRVPATTPTTPREAGAALLALAFVGRSEAPEPPQLAPSRRYDAWIRPGVTVDTTVDLFRRAFAKQLTADELSWLVPAATHPAHAEVATLARAQGLEYADAVWKVPLPPTMSVLALPVLPDRGLSAVAARRARIAVLLRDGKVAEAELAARELLSAGLVLRDHGFMLLDNVVGLRLARTASSMLEQILEVTGQNARLATFRQQIEIAKAVAHTALLGSADAAGNGIEYMRTQRNIVADPDALHGLRWEFFESYNTAASCLNLNRLVYGAGPDHEKWIQASRATLVRTQGEEHLFKLARHGFFGTAEGWPISWRGRLMSIGLAGSSNIARCMSLLDVR